MRAARKNRGLSMMDLAKRSGLSYNEISQLELDKRMGNIVTLELLADALGVSLDEYVGHTVREWKEDWEDVW